MGEECSTCRICTDQEEIRAESTIGNNPIITNKNGKDILNERSHKTSQKSTYHTVKSNKSSNNDKYIDNHNKILCNKYKRKEGRIVQTQGRTYENNSVRYLNKLGNILSILLTFILF